MKNIIILLIGFFVLTSCNLCKKLTDSSDDEEVVQLDDKDKQKSEETYENESSGKDSDDDKPNVEIQGDDGIQMLEFNRRNIPSEISYSGNIVTGKRWADNNGENILILTKTPVRTTHAEYDERLNSAELYGYHYVRIGDRFKLLWKINDFIKDCEFDLTLDFINNSLTITDLDNDGVAESTFLYKLACRSDVTPSTLKLMMHENENKYALRGDMYITIEGDKYGGSYKVDNAFYSAPNVFLDYAKQQWRDFSQEVF